MLNAVPVYSRRCCRMTSCGKARASRNRPTFPAGDGLSAVATRPRAAIQGGSSSDLSDCAPPLAVVLSRLYAYLTVPRQRHSVRNLDGRRKDKEGPHLARRRGPE